MATKRQLGHFNATASYSCTCTTLELAVATNPEAASLTFHQVRHRLGLDFLTACAIRRGIQQLLHHHKLYFAHSTPPP
jgi:hypothetical protein